MRAYSGGSNSWVSLRKLQKSHTLVCSFDSNDSPVVREEDGVFRALTATILLRLSQSCKWIERV